VKRCARCHQGIAANELVMKARELVYHISCFTCSSCHKPLSTGDQFGMKENLIYCRNDYELLFQGEYFQSIADDLCNCLPLNSDCHTIVLKLCINLPIPGGQTSPSGRWFFRFLGRPFCTVPTPL
jgi:hypothetical protein